MFESCGRLESKYVGRKESTNWAKSSGIIYRIDKLAQCEHERVVQLIRLECPFPGRSRFLVIVCNEEAKEYCLLGVDCINTKDNSRQIMSDNTKRSQPCSIVEANGTIGLVIKLSIDTVPRFDGDGGFKIKYAGRNFLFKPVSLQALWKIILTLEMISDHLTSTERKGNSEQQSLAPIPEDNIEDIPKYDWIEHYQNRLKSPQSCINLWEQFEDIMSKRQVSAYKTVTNLSGSLCDGEDIQTVLKAKLRSIMRHVDLDRITSKAIRKQLETEMGENLNNFRAFIDEEILLVLGQMDPSSKILEYLYLGSEWNASNFVELKEHKITHILNVTREIDNFYPESFKYLNIRVWDLGSIQSKKNGERQYLEV